MPMMMRPMPTASAIADPDIPAKIMLATTLTWPRPPRKRPTRTEAELQQPVGQAADIHQVGRQDEQRDCEQDVAVEQPVEDLLGSSSEIEA